MDISRQKVSLTFSKQIEKKELSKSTLAKEITPEINNKKIAITSYDENIKIGDSSDTNEDLIIPLIKRNVKPITKSLQSSQSLNANLSSPTSSLSLEEKAAVALIEESKEKLNHSVVDNLKIELDEINPVADIPENENFNQAAAEVSTVEDYEKINVDCFGSAMLRGMGWNKGEGVGKFNKKVINIINPSANNLLMSSKRSKNGNRSKNVSEELLPLKKGCYVEIVAGRNRGTVATVLSIEEDCLLVQPSRSQNTLREVEQNVRVISTHEFKESSRVINKRMYDDFKINEKALKKKEKKGSSKDDEFENEEDSRNLNQSSISQVDHKDKGHDTRGHKDPHERRSERKSSANRREREYDRNEKVNRNRSKPIEDERSTVKECNSSETVKQYSIPWARENLRVRIIDKDYKNGDYYKEKVIVQSVDSFESCSCLTTSGRLIEGLNPNKIETVIPKTPYAVVMIVKGSHKGKKGRIFELHKTEEKASVQLSDKGIIKFHYDDICEYVT